MKALVMLRAYGRWLFQELWIFWVTALVLVTFLGICLLLWESERNIRWAGGLLQLLGLGTVALGIHDTRKLFGLPSMLERLGEWLSHRPGRARTVQLSGVGALGLAGSFGRGYSSAKVGPDASIEDRVAALERNYESAQRQINDAWLESEKKHGEAKQWVEAERHERKAETGEVKAKLDRFATGGIYLSIMGTAWIVVGTILSTASIEIHCFLGS